MKKHLIILFLFATFLSANVSAEVPVFPLTKAVNSNATKSSSRKPLFKNQSELINYIDSAYGESNPGKGMKTAELKKVFAKAKQHRKGIQ
jgi:hypothetical protein